MSSLKENSGRGVLDNSQERNSFFGKRKCFFFGGCLLIGILGAFFFARLPLAKITIYAPFSQVRQEEVKEWLMQEISGSFWRIDLKRITNVLQEKPWIFNVIVVRNWWGELVITFEEYEPIARWHGDRLLSRDGVVFKPDSVAPFSSLPLLIGLDSQATELMYRYFSINRLTSSSGLLISRLEWVNNGAWIFDIGSVIVQLGRDKKLERLKRFMRFYRSFLRTYWNNVKKVDLRYVHGVSVVWKDQRLKPVIGGR